MTNHNRAMTAGAVLAAKNFAQRYIGMNPEASNLRLKTDIAAYKPRNKALLKVPEKAVAMFLRDPSFCSLSNEKLATALKGEVGYPVPPNMLSEPLRKSDLKTVAGYLGARGITLDLKVHNTPSKIKKALRAGSTATAAPQQFEGSVSFSDDAVVVGDRRFPAQIDKNGYHRVRVGEHRINVAALKQLLLQIH